MNPIFTIRRDTETQRYVISNSDKVDLLLYFDDLAIAKEAVLMMLLKMGVIYIDLKPNLKCVK